MLLSQKLSKLVETLAGEDNSWSDNDKEHQASMAGETSAHVTPEEEAKLQALNMCHSKFACIQLTAYWQHS